MKKMNTVMKKVLKRALLFLAFMTSALATYSQDETDGSESMYDLSLEDLLQIELYDENFQLYGYIN